MIPDAVCGREVRNVSSGRGTQLIRIKIDTDKRNAAPQRGPRQGAGAGSGGRSLQSVRSSAEPSARDSLREGMRARSPARGHQEGMGDIKPTDPAGFHRAVVNHEQSLRKPAGDVNDLAADERVDLQ